MRLGDVENYFRTAKIKRCFEFPFPNTRLVQIKRGNQRKISTCHEPQQKTTRQTRMKVNAKQKKRFSPFFRRKWTRMETACHWEKKFVKTEPDRREESLRLQHVRGYLEGEGIRDSGKLKLISNLTEKFQKSASGPKEFHFPGSFL